MKGDVTSSPEFVPEKPETEPDADELEDPESLAIGETSSELELELDFELELESELVSV